MPFSTSDTKRICGYALAPRLAPGRPKASLFPFSSATSSVLPSMLTRRHARYHAPFVAATATGVTTSSCNCRSGSHPSLVRACEMPELPATWIPVRGFHQPLDSFQQTTQHFPIRRLHVQRQRDHVIHDHMRRQVPLTHALFSRGRQRRTNLIQREGFGHHSQTDVVRDAAAGG